MMGNTQNGEILIELQFNQRKNVNFKQSNYLVEIKNKI